MREHTIQTVLAAMLLCCVLLLIITRPKGLHAAWSAGVGAVLAIVLGLLSVYSLATIFNTTWDACATLISLFLLSEALDSNGFFTWAALCLARWGRGSGWLLYALVLLLTTAVTALLANDGAVLMLTPIFAQLFNRIYPDDGTKLPFILAMGFFADAMSAIVVPSNLTNIIFADASQLSFVRVALWMMLPMLAAFMAGAIAFGIRFRTRLGTVYKLEVLGDPAQEIYDRPTFWLGWIALLVLVVGYIVGGELHWPVSLVAGTVALAMVLLVQVRKLRSANKIVRAAPWSILIYAIGMFIIITAAFQVGVLGMLVNPLRVYIAPHSGPGGALAAGSMLALLSAAVNNLPATLVGVLALHSIPAHSSIAIYAMILGVDIGPKLTPFGSLATLLWLGILARNKISISWGTYLRENWWVTVLVLGAAFLGLLAANGLWG